MGVDSTVVRAHQQANRARLGSKGGRPPRFDSEAYEQRNYYPVHNVGETVGRGDRDVRRTAIGLAALVVISGVLSGCGQEPESGTPTVPGSNRAAEAPDRSLAAPAPVGPTTHTISITIRGGQATGDTGRVTVPLGTPVTLSVTSDVADEIHVRGYDRKAKIPAGGTVSVSFTANSPGVFDVELEESKLQMLQLHVT